MPIRPENKARYPKGWEIISLWIRTWRAKNRCEWCYAENYKPHPITGSKVVLTVAHIDHVIENMASENLAALCQRCHNKHDAPMRRAGIKARQRAQNAIGELVP